jgi:hypothetical protein
MEKGATRGQGAEGFGGENQRWGTARGWLEGGCCVVWERPDVKKEAVATWALVQGGAGGEGEGEVPTLGAATLSTKDQHHTLMPPPTHTRHCNSSLLTSPAQIRH